MNFYGSSTFHSGQPHDTEASYFVFNRHNPDGLQRVPTTTEYASPFEPPAIRMSFNDGGLSFDQNYVDGQGVADFMDLDNVSALHGQHAQYNYQQAQPNPPKGYLMNSVYQQYMPPRAVHSHLYADGLPQRSQNTPSSSSSSSSSTPTSPYAYPIGPHPSASRMHCYPVTPISQPRSQNAPSVPTRFDDMESRPTKRMRSSNNFDAPVVGSPALDRLWISSEYAPSTRGSSPDTASTTTEDTIDYAERGSNSKTRGRSKKQAILSAGQTHSTKAGKGDATFGVFAVKTSGPVEEPHGDTFMSTVNLDASDQQEDFQHGPTDLPPRMYPGGPDAASPWKPRKNIGTVPGSALDYLPQVEKRIKQLETSVDRYMQHRGLKALQNSILPEYQ